MKQLIAALFGILLLSTPFVWASEPEYSASPSAQPQQTLTPTRRITPTVMVTPIPIPLCQQLKIVKGNGGIAPETVTFQTVASAVGSAVTYRYHFGDGAIEEGKQEIEHRYIGGGEYTAYVEIQDKKGFWHTDDACKTTLTLKQAPLISGRVACGEVMVTNGDGSAAPARVTFNVNGKGPVEEIRQYRLDFGDGVVEEASDSAFSHMYVSPGTYQVKGYVKDGMGVMYGGTNACIKTVKMLSATPLTTQPETGVGNETWVLIVLMGITALVLRIFAYVDTHID